MKKSVVLVSFMFLFSISFISAACNLDVSLINQDPYPAVPGEYVKVVFQVEGVTNLDCGEIKISVDEVYPFYLDSSENTKSIRSGTFYNDYKTHWIVPYTLRVDPNALDGDNNLTITYSTKTGTFKKNFEINVDNALSEFEIAVKQYDFTTKKINLELINLGDQELEAVTIEVPRQDNVLIYGSNKETIGTLSSNEEDTVSFTGDFYEGEIEFIINYNDQTNTRRTYKTSAYFDREAFSRTVQPQSSFSISSFVYGIILVVALRFAYKFYRKKKGQKPLKHH